MYNDLFTVFGLTVHGYGLMIGLGVIFSMLWAERRAKSRGLNADLVASVYIWALLIGFTGAKILFIITVWDSFIADPLSVLGGEGFVVYGGLAFGALAVWLRLRHDGERFPVWADILLPPIALAQAFGRVGCFLAGCCYGRETHSVLGVVFPAGSFAPSGVPLLPTQLFSAAGDLLLAVVLARLDKKPHRDGQTGLWYMLLYSVGRFLVECFRDDPRGSVGALSTSQFISIFTFAAGLLVLLVSRGRASKEAEA